MSDLKNFIARWSRRKRAATEDAPPQAPALPFAQTRHTSPCKGEVGEQSEPGGGQRQRSHASSDPHPTNLPSLREAKLVDLPLVGGGITESASTGIAFDVTQLPPIESITAESDISGFLAPGVPAELTRAALRRAWAVDPKIRDFVGLAENAWDFNSAGAIPGFGPLEMTDELRRHIAQFFSRDLGGPSSPQSSPAVEAQENRAAIGVSPIEPSTAIPPAPVADLQPANSTERSSAATARTNLANSGEADRREPGGSVGKRLHGRALPE